MYFSGLTFYQKHLPTCFMSVDAFYGLNGSNVSYLNSDAVNQLVPNTSLVYSTPSNNQTVSIGVDIEATDCVFKVDATKPETVLLYDTFTGVNGTPLTAHTPDIGGQYFSGTNVVVQDMVLLNGTLSLFQDIGFYFPTNKIVLPATNFYIEFDIQYFKPLGDTFNYSYVIFSSFFQSNNITTGNVETSYGYNLLEVLLYSNGTSFISGIGSDGSVLGADRTIGTIESVVPGYVSTDKVKIRAEFINYSVFKVYAGGNYLNGSSHPLAGTIGNNQFCIFLSSSTNDQNTIRLDNLKIGIIGDTFKNNAPIIKDMRIDKPDVAAGTSIENFRYYTYYTSYLYDNLPNVVDYTLAIDWIDSGYITQVDCQNTTTDPSISTIRRLNFVNLPQYPEYKIIEVINFDIMTHQLYYTTNTGTFIQVITIDKLIEYPGILYGERVNLKFYWDGTNISIVDSVRITSTGL